MPRIKTIIVALVAVFALSAVAASAASAAPEIGRCLPQSEGKYKDSNCTEKVGKKETGSYEKKPEAIDTGFTSVSGEGTLETTSGVKVRCTGDTDTGKYSGTKEVVELFVIFTGCELVGGDTTCQDAGGPAGEIKTTELTGKLGYIEKATSEVGLSLTPATKKGPFAEFECYEEDIAPIKITVEEGSGKGGNSVIGVIGPVNTMTSTFTLEFKQKDGIQDPEMFEGGSLDVLETENRQAGEETTDTITNGEALEIFA